MDGIRWAGELGAVGRWKGPMTPGDGKQQSKSEANLPPVHAVLHQSNTP
jgi:hypothetical protein